MALKDPEALGGMGKSVFPGHLPATVWDWEEMGGTAWDVDVIFGYGIHDIVCGL